MMKRAPMKMNTCSTGACDAAEEVEAGDDAAVAHDLLDGDDAHQRRVLVERDELGHRRRHHAPQALGQDHEPHRLPVGHPERGRRLALAAVERQDPRAHDLGEDRRVVEDEAEQGREHAARLQRLGEKPGTTSS